MVQIINRNEAEKHCIKNHNNTLYCYNSARVEFPQIIIVENTNKILMIIFLEMNSSEVCTSYQFELVKYYGDKSILIILF